MLMRLKPSIKYDADGKEIKQVRKWYSNFRYKGEKIEVTLHSYQSQVKLANQNLWQLQKDLESGKVINGFNKSIKKLKPLKPFDKEHQALRDKHIIPFFGGYTPNELTPELIEKYMESKWGRDEPGNLQAMEGTWK